MAPATDDVIAALDSLRAEIEACTLCDLHATRTRGVPGDGDPGADLMFVGEAPGYHEDQQGRPFVGKAGRLLEQLLESIGLTRDQVFIANVLKSRPPENRDPRPDEIAACQPYLWRQIELIKPKVICTLGNFSTKLLTGDETGITRVHGRPQATEISGHRLYLYPIFHPAAALYTPAMLTTLREDFSRLPALLAHAAPAPGEEAAGLPAAEPPAWRPPERLQRTPEPAAEPAPPSPASTPEEAAAEPEEAFAAARSFLAGRPVVDGDGAPSPTAPAPEDASSPEADPSQELVPAPESAVLTEPAAANPPASAADPPFGPPVEPEQLGLF